jgi:hypothetical protein
MVLWSYNIAESFDFNRFSSMSAAFRCTRSTMNDEGKTNRELRGRANHCKKKQRRVLKSHCVCAFRTRNHRENDRAQGRLYKHLVSERWRL